VKQEGGRNKKVREKAPRTPCERLLGSPDVSQECKAELLRGEGLCNPAVLDGGLNQAVERLSYLNREKFTLKMPPVRRLLRSVRPDFG
jgi:hypothetical protein